MRYFSRAFTLIELLLVIGIIAVLTIAFLPGALKAPAKARDQKRVKDLQNIAAALDSYGAEHQGTLPPHPTASFNSYCLSGIAFTSPLKTYFANKKYPVDSKPSGNGGCNKATTAYKPSYFYRMVNKNYVIGAVMEIRASGNTSACFPFVAGCSGNISVTTIFGPPLSATLQRYTLRSGNGRAITATPNAARPYFIILGPR